MLFWIHGLQCPEIRKNCWDKWAPSTKITVTTNTTVMETLVPLIHLGFFSFLCGFSRNVNVSHGDFCSKTQNLMLVYGSQIWILHCYVVTSTSYKQTAVTIFGEETRL